MKIIKTKFKDLLIIKQKKILIKEEIYVRLLVIEY